MLIDTVEAARRANRSTQTVRRWASRYKLGRKIAGRFVIDAAALDNLLAGHAGDDARG
jgi:hypothetical protein